VAGGRAAVVVVVVAGGRFVSVAFAAVDGSQSAGGAPCETRSCVFCGLGARFGVFAFTGGRVAGGLAAGAGVAGSRADGVMSSGFLVVSGAAAVALGGFPPPGFLVSVFLAELMAIGFFRRTRRSRRSG
jgi:hypothetical protein